MEKSCFHVGGKEICQLHHSVFLLLASALVNCFSLQFTVSIDQNAIDIKQFTEFFTCFDKNYLNGLCYKLLKIVVNTNELRGSDVAEQLLLPLCVLSRVVRTEFVEFHLHFSNCPIMYFILPTSANNALIRRLCFIDLNSTKDDGNFERPFHQHFYFTLNLHFHQTFPAQLVLQFDQIETSVKSVGFCKEIEFYDSRLPIGNSKVTPPPSPSPSPSTLPLYPPPPPKEA